jgi:TolB-like protein
MPNKLSQFWQELKRRKVVRVITIYAAVAFVILQLVEILAPSLRLPEWTMNFILVILIVGFIIAVILSWIYDVHPEEGIVKTEPADKLKTDEIPATSNRWKIASYISFVVIVGLIVLNIIPRAQETNERSVPEKSIAVRPFWNESTDQENEFFVNGMTEDIRINLARIADLRVLSRGSVEKYRDTDYSTMDLARDLQVSYVLEGTAQRIGNQIKIHVQLIHAETDNHIWETSYREEIADVKQVFDIQNQIAQLVAAEIEAIITPKEKEHIDKIPTTNLTAYDFYQRGKDEHLKYQLDNYNREALKRAKDLYQDALKYDSTYAQAYTGLAQVYREKHYWETFLTENFLDSMLILADIALSFDDQLAEAYVIRGDYYEVNYEKEQAINEYDKAIKLNPNYWRAYWQKGGLHYYDDLVKTIDNFQKAASLQRGPFLPEIYRMIGRTYAMAGFKETSIYYGKEALKLDDESALYYSFLAEIEDCNGNFDKAVEFGEKSYAIDSTDIWVIYLLGLDHMYLGQFEESLEYLKKEDKILKTLDRLHPNATFRTGYAYWVNGFKEEAEYYFNTGLELHIEIIELGRHYNQDFHTFYILAAMYAFLGDKDKAYENLRLVNQRQRMPLWMIKDIKNDPLFNSIRDEPEFQQIVRDIEDKYQAEHERVRQWLQENDML